MNELYNENLFSERFRIKSARLSKWDYSSPGYYFVTICTINKTNYFGNIENEIMIMSDIGKIVLNELIYTQKIRKNIILDEWIIMPNHIHFIINIVETHCNASLQKTKQFNKFGPQINNLASIIRGFKSAVKRICNKNGYNTFNWQPRYYDRIIRNNYELNAIRQYIKNNPKNWEKERSNILRFFS